MDVACTEEHEVAIFWVLPHWLAGCTNRNSLALRLCSATATAMLQQPCDGPTKKRHRCKRTRRTIVLQSFVYRFVVLHLACVEVAGR